MLHLFTHTFFWFASLLITGFFIGWWLRGKTDATEQLQNKQASVSAEKQTIVSKAEDGQQYNTPNTWAPEGLIPSPVEGKDNLNLIKGIGPKLEEQLNNLGFYKYSQLALLSENNIAWLRERLKSRRKLPIEEWVLLAKKRMAKEQAKSG